VPTPISNLPLYIYGRKGVANPAALDVINFPVEGYEGGIRKGKNIPLA
jgi:hypothetical protein